MEEIAVGTACSYYLSLLIRPFLPDVLLKELLRPLVAFLPRGQRIHSEVLRGVVGESGDDLPVKIDG